MNFRNKNAEQLVKAMQAASDEFEERNKNAIFRSILFGLAEAFPEDRHKIFKTFGKREIKQVNQGGAKITRKADEPVTKKTGSGCDGCGSSTVLEAVAPDPTVRTGGKRRATSQVDLSEFESIEDILDRFESRPAAIIAFAQTQGISIPASVTRARTAAKYILAKAEDIRAHNEEEE